MKKSEIDENRKVVLEHMIEIANLSKKMLLILAEEQCDTAISALKLTEEVLRNTSQPEAPDWVTEMQEKYMKPLTTFCDDKKVPFIFSPYGIMKESTKKAK